MWVKTLFLPSQVEGLGYSYPTLRLPLWLIYYTGWLEIYQGKVIGKGEVFLFSPPNRMKRGGGGGGGRMKP